MNRPTLEARMWNPVESWNYLGSVTLAGLMVEYHPRSEYNPREFWLTVGLLGFFFELTLRIGKKED